jgi:hypothetical protein
MPIAIVLVGEERNQTHEYQKAIENVSHLPILSIRIRSAAGRGTKRLPPLSFRVGLSLEGGHLPSCMRDTFICLQIRPSLPSPLSARSGSEYGSVGRSERLRLTPPESAFFVRAAGRS